MICSFFFAALFDAGRSGGGTAHKVITATNVRSYTTIRPSSQKSWANPPPVGDYAEFAVSHFTRLILTPSGNALRPMAPAFKLAGMVTLLRSVQLTKA